MLHVSAQQNMGMSLGTPALAASEPLPSTSCDLPRVKSSKGRDMKVRRLWVPTFAAGHVNLKPSKPDAAQELLCLGSRDATVGWEQCWGMLTMLGNAVLILLDLYVHVLIGFMVR